MYSYVFLFSVSLLWFSSTVSVSWNKMPLTLACALQQNFSIAHSPNIGLIILSSCYRHAVCCRIQTHAKHRAWTKEGKSNLKGLKVRICLITRAWTRGRMLPVCLEKVSSLSSCSASASISSSVSQPSSSAFPGSSKSTSPKSSAKSSDSETERKSMKMEGEVSILLKLIPAAKNKPDRYVVVR